MPWGNFEASPYETPAWNQPKPGGSTSTPNWWDRNQNWVMAGVEALGSVGGALYSNRQNRKAEERAAALQREFAQHGVRWRVEDAKAAGLHPLYALGGQLPSASPSFAMDSVGPALAEAGQSVSRAVAAQQTSNQRRAEALSMQVLESQIRETDARAGLARAETLRALRDAGSGFPEVNMPEEALIGDTASTSGGAVLSPPRVNMSRPDEKGIVAGPANPSLREYALPGGYKMMLPDANSLGEALEPLSESWGLAWAVYKENVRLYGPEWRREFLRRYAPAWMQMALGVYRDRKFRRFEHEAPEATDRDMKRFIDEMR